MAMKKLVVCAASALFAAVASATTLYVAPVAGGTEDGSDFDNAMTLAQAVGAIPAGSADAWNEIVLQSGTKESPLVYDFSAITASFSISKAYVRVRSEANDPATIRLLGGYTDNSVRCFTLSANTELSGLTITNWYNSAGLGAAVYCANRTTCLITNCVIATCKSSWQGGGCYQGRHIGNTYVDCCSGFCGSNETSGGAIYGADYVYGCTFTGNYGTPNASGKEIAGSCIATEDLAYTVDRCTFLSNLASAQSLIGGRNLNAGTIVTNCTFKYNLAPCGGTRFSKCVFEANRYACLNDGTAIDCLFLNNTNESGSAAVALSSTVRRGLITGSQAKAGAYHTVGHRSSFYDCIISNNVVNSGQSGLITVETRVQGCTFIHNTLNAGLMFSGTDGSQRNPRVADCVFAYNTLAGQFFDSARQVTNCLFVANTNTVSSRSFLGGNGASHYNCTFIDNYGKNSQSGVGGWYGTYCNCLFLRNKPYDITGDRSNTQYVNYYNCAYGTRCTAVGNAYYGNWVNTVQVPDDRIKFHEPDGLHPWGGCPQRRFREVVGAGSNELCTAETDLAGLPRVYGGTIDIGCYENQEPNPGLLLLVK